MSDAAIADLPVSDGDAGYGTGPIEEFGPAPRRKSVPVQIGNVTVGGTAPIVVQSMTNTDTADIDATVKQVLALARSRRCRNQAAHCCRPVRSPAGTLQRWQSFFPLTGFHSPH